MKIRLFVLAAGMMLLSFAGNAQKIGYVKVESLFNDWPEYKSADSQVKEYDGQLTARLQSKVKDFQTKLQNYQETGGTMDAVTRQDTETELQNLQTQIQQFEANAQQSVAEKQLTLFTPLQQRMKETIDAVAKENGYTHIFAYGSALVFAADESADISGLVAQKLGFSLSQQ